MMYHSFDTHEAVKNFIKSGIKESQAEAIIQAIAVSRNTDISHLATKSDLAIVKSDLATVKSDLATVKSDLEKQISNVDSRISIETEKIRSEIEKSKNEILKWVLGMNIATMSIIIAVFKLFAS